MLLHTVYVIVVGGQRNLAIGMAIYGLCDSNDDDLKRSVILDNFQILCKKAINELIAEFCYSIAPACECCAYSVCVCACVAKF